MVAEGEFEAAPVRNLGILDLSTGKWSSPGTPNGAIYAIAASGSEIFICGAFTAIDGMRATYFARYDLFNRCWSSSSPFTLSNDVYRDPHSLSSIAVHNGKVYVSEDP